MKKIGIIGKSLKTETMLRFIRKTKDFGVNGIYDPSLVSMQQFGNQIKIKVFDNPFLLIQDSDLLFVQLSDQDSYNFIIECILNGKHVVIGNPVKLSIVQLEELSKLSAEAMVSVVPFLPYRFSTCLLESKSYIYNPVFIEVRYHNSPEFKQSRSDQLETILNMVDVVTNLVKAQHLSVSANAVKIVGSNPQLINASIEFNNGCHVNMGANFIANREEFLLTVFQPMQLVTIDLMKNHTLVKNFRSDNVFEYDATKPVSSKDENPYNELLNYLNYFETYNTPVAILDQFADTIRLYKEIEEKLFL